RAAAIHPQLPVGRVMLRVALDRDDVNGLRLVRVHVDRETKVAGQAAAHLLPGLTGVVAAHHVPVLLHEKHTRTGAVHHDAVYTVADFRRRVGHEFRPQAAVDWFPGLAAVVSS